MRTNRNKDFNKIPNSLENAKPELNRIALTKDLESIDDKIYKGKEILISDKDDPYFQKKEFEVRYELRKLYFNKCAYCESIEYKPDVEHYRPKKSTTGDQGNTLGYYWLCYEWSNLIPACYACNSKNGKWNKFPILSKKRITKPPIKKMDGTLDFEKCRANNPYLGKEKPALLHPEVDIPENFFKIGINGQLEGTDGNNGRGWNTVKICDLNRGNLRKSRKDIIDNIINEIYTIFVDYRNGGLTIDYLPKKIRSEFKKIIEKSAITQVYSFVSYYFISMFYELEKDYFPLLSDEEREFLLEQFRQIKNHNP
jgi:uncharacterized protein (TIGR02646 family)